jgi:hypothetical protein
MTKFRFVALTAFAVLALSGSLVSATPLVVSCTPVSGPTELNDNIACPQFSTGLGALISIEITVTGSISGSLTLTNNTATVQRTNATTTSQMNVGSLAGFSFVDPIFVASFTTGLQSLNAGQTVAFTGLTGGGSASLGTNTSILAPYTGLGTFDIPISTLSGFNLVGGGGHIGSLQTTSGTANAVVTYNYQPQNDTGTPEPASMALVGGGLLALGWTAKRLRRS